tara:strand:+ start:489 stop:734 length:246 start_codon:yes stop_codon:yes gene_type:complete
MDSIRRNLKRAREAEPMSREQYSLESWALGTLKGHVSYWADLRDFRGNKMTGHRLVAWKKEVFDRIVELDKIFKEDSDAKK